MNKMKQCSKCNNKVEHGYDTPYGYFCIDCWMLKRKPAFPKKMKYPCIGSYIENSNNRLNGNTKEVCI
jgi:hypothetical protein